MNKPLSNVQEEILKSFNYTLNDTELASFKEMLTDYFSNKISNDIDRLFDENGWDDRKADEWASTHMRTNY